MKKKHDPFIKQMLLETFRYFAKGGFYLHHAHLPPPNGHRIPTDFLGVCVASNANPETDAYVITQLEALGIKQVRLDFSYDDVDHYHTRFLEALIAKGFNITLHLIAPFDAASHMNNPAEQIRWEQFVTLVLNRFGASIKQVEIGNTINRKRWSGYQLSGFITAWDIAYKATKARNIQLIGPNVQDFEPMYNIAVLKTLRDKDQLPDVQTDNIFVERVMEPERYDHRVLKYKWTRFFKFNLIKKTRLIQKIGLDFGVAQTISSAAFWAIYRIKRILPDGEQKQADYLVRYFTLLAASNALQQANWGALICHREGLINDGLSNAEYPDLERIARYQSADGNLQDYVRYPSFYAMKFIHQHLSGANYQSAVVNTRHLQIHHFTRDQWQYHIAWTTNGKVAFLADIYTKSTLTSANISDRDGAPLDKNSAFICESPIYLRWPIAIHINLNSKPSLANNLAFHAHIADLEYFRYEENNWHGLILAKNAIEAQKLMLALNPEKLQAPDKHRSLRHARNAIWAIEDPRDQTRKLTIKQPIKMYPHKAFLDRFKPSKANRSWNGAIELLRRGIDTAQPVAYFEKIGDQSLKQNFYICEHVQADFTIGEIFTAFSQGDPIFRGLQAEDVYKQFAQFCQKMHAGLIFFRDFSGGNILVKQSETNQLSFTLIDTARLRTVEMTPFPFKYRMADLVRACHKLHPAGRARMMQIYLGLNGKQYDYKAKYAFFLYDCKVKLKRTVGRKGLKKLLKRMNGKQ